MARKRIVTATINEREESFLCEPRQTLLETLRDLLDLTGSKEGCSNGNCGACTVILNGRPVDSVTIPANCQFSRIGFRKPPFASARPSPKGSAHTQLATKRGLTSNPEGPRLCSKSVTLCGPPTSPPPEAGEPA